MPGAAALEAYLAQQQRKQLMRFIACGSVDDGKSTLIGRLLYEAKAVFADQLAAVEAQSRRAGAEGAIDFSLLTDGLAAEREQGITIDVAYRYFSTPRRSFIVADAPGHEQYTRNMATGASTADLAVILVDARKGVLTQTKRHSYLAHLLGVRRFVLAVNKMDLIGFDQARFEAVVSDYAGFAASIGAEAFTAIPICAVSGENVSAPSARMPWYRGQALLAHLETVELAADGARAASLRVPVQWVNRADASFRGYAGQIVSGVVRPGDRVRISPSGVLTNVARVMVGAEDQREAVAGQSVMLTFADEIDCSRGDVIAAADDPPEAADQYEATLVWFAQEPLLVGRSYWLKLATQTVSAIVQQPKHRVNVNTLEQLAAKTLTLNDIGVANIVTDRRIAFAPYAQSRALGGFILIDKTSNATVAAGMLHFALRRAHNVHWQAGSVAREARAALLQQKPAVVWLTGLSGAGKSTIANMVEQKLAAMGRHTFLLDGDNVRHGLSRDLGFTDADRIENMRRVGEVARLMCDAGLIVVTAFISPFRAEREMVRALMAPGEFLEVHVHAPLAEAERRDVKGLYRKARAGQLKNFTGIDSPYEAPEHPDVFIDTTAMSAEAAADLIVARLLG